MGSKILAVFFLCQLTTAVNATHQREFVAKCIGVVDGDTIDVLLKGKIKRIRLASIDCPELRGDGGQPFCEVSKKFTSNFCFGKEVQIRKTGTHFNRWLGFVSADGKCLNHELLRSGLAWHDVKYSDDTTLQDMHDKAKVSRKGLWIDPNPINPSMWRRGCR